MPAKNKTYFIAYTSTLNSQQGPVTGYIRVKLGINVPTCSVQGQDTAYPVYRDIKLSGALKNTDKSATYYYRWVSPNCTAPSANMTNSTANSTKSNSTNSTVAPASAVCYL